MIETSQKPSMDFSSSQQEETIVKSEEETLEKTEKGSSSSFVSDFEIEDDIIGGNAQHSMMMILDF